jgi:hypothetical protein
MYVAVIADVDPAGYAVLNEVIDGFVTKPASAILAAARHGSLQAPPQSTGIPRLGKLSGQEAKNEGQNWNVEIDHVVLLLVWVSLSLIMPCVYF